MQVFCLSKQNTCLLRVRCAVEKAVENNEVEAKAILLALLAKE